MAWRRLRDAPPPYRVRPRGRARNVRPLSLARSRHRRRAVYKKNQSGAAQCRSPQIARRTREWRRNSPAAALFLGGLGRELKRKELQGSDILPRSVRPSSSRC